MTDPLGLLPKTDPLGIIPEEKEFQSWYQGWSKKLGLNPDPDDPQHFYDYRAAFRGGAEPTVESGWHWPSEFKREGHPRMIVDGVNTKTGARVDSGAFTDWWTDFLENKPADREKIFYSLVTSQETGLPPSLIYGNTDSIPKGWMRQHQTTLLGTVREILEIPKSLGEVGLSFASGAVGWGISSILGIAEATKPGATREKVRAAAEDAGRRIVYEPETRPARDFIGRAGRLIGALTAPAREAAALVGESWDSPFLEAILSFAGEYGILKLIGSGAEKLQQPPEWYYRVTVQERGVVEGIKADISSGELTTAQVRDLWRDPANRAELLKRYQGVAEEGKVEAAPKPAVLPVEKGETLPSEVEAAEPPPAEIVEPGAKKPVELVQIPSLADPESFEIGGIVNFDGGISGKVIETGKGYVLVEGSDKLYRVAATTEIPVVKVQPGATAKAAGGNPFKESVIREPVYHGTGAGQIETFDLGMLGVNTGANSAKKGFFFTTSKDTADTYSKYHNQNLRYEYDILKDELWNATESGNKAEIKRINDRQDEIIVSIKNSNQKRTTIEAYVNIENPLVVDRSQTKEKISDVIDRARENGHDGVILRNEVDAIRPPLAMSEWAEKNLSGQTIIVFNPDQIKSLPNPSRPPLAAGQTGATPGGEPGGSVSVSIPPELPIEPEIGLIDYDDPNTVFNMAARTDEAAGPPPTSEYDKIRVEAARIAYEKTTKKIDMQKRREARALERQGVEDARQDPVYTAMQEIIKRGGLKRDWLLKTWDRDTVNELSRKRIGLVTKDGAVGLDEIAADNEFFVRGDMNADDVLMNAMLDWKGLAEAGKRAAAAFEERMADLLSESEKEDFHLTLLEEEAKILRKMIKATGKPSAPGIKKVIREQTGQIRVDELMVSEYEAMKAGMKKAEQASRKAFREGKLDGALVEKERQIEMARSRREKLKAKEEAKKIHDGLVKLTKDNSIPEDYQDRIQDLLEDFDLMPRSNRAARRVESAREFLERQKAAGEDVSIPESMLNRIERYGKVHWRELTLDQLREIHDQAQMYAHLGKLKNKLIAAKEGREFEAVVETIVTEIGKNWGVKPVSPEQMETIFLDKTFGEKLGDFKASYLGSLTKVETYLRRLDGFKDLGPIWEIIYLPFKKASDVEYRRLAEIVKDLRGLFEPVKKSITKEKFRIPGVDQFLTRETVAMAAMNSGNEGNLKALQENRVYNWDDAKINTILGNVTPEEWLLVRGIWDMFEKQYPDLAAVYKNLSGTTLKKVEGDYFPVVFDRKLSWIADRNATEKELRDFFQSIYTLPSVKSGSTIERVGGKLPPKLKFSVIFEKLAEINHYITHAEAVRDVQKILADLRVRAAIEGAPSGIGGPEAYREMMTWLQDVARQTSDPMSAVEAAVKTARINTSVVAMGWKFSTAAVQFLGATNTIYKVGVGEFTKALAEFFTNREVMVEKIKGMSAEISGRSKVFDRELRDAYNRIGLDQFRGSQAMKDSFFSLISLMDMEVAYLTWLSAYNKGMKDFAGEESEAIEFADMTTRMTQGTALVKDLAGIQRGSEMKKILSMFYTFFSSYHQMMSDAWIKFKFDKTAGNFGDLIKAWWWLTILPATLQYMMQERDIPSPSEFFKQVFQQRLTAYPVIRDITGAVLTDYDYQMSPVSRAGEVVGRFAKETVKAITPDEDLEWDKVLRYGLESAGYMTGLPTGQAVVTMTGLMDLWNGETSDVTRLLFRAPREEND